MAARQNHNAIERSEPNANGKTNRLNIVNFVKAVKVGRHGGRVVK